MTADILLVDDNAIQASTRRSILLKTGKTVALASGALQALAMLDNPELRQSLGLIITDHSMPGMNGPDMVQRLRARLPSIPVIVLSGYPDVEEEYPGMNIVFRMKPLAPDQLIALAKSLLNSPLTRSA
jgi:CheY-like chemotaxis protein